MKIGLQIGGFNISLATTRTGGAYEGATTGRRARGWAAPDVGPTRAILDSADLVRNRARQLGRNNPWAGNGLDSFVANCVGTGIRPRSKAADAATRERIQELWEEWIDDADADQILDFYGLQGMVARGLIESGEVFVRLRRRRLGDGLTVPLQIQILEADHVPLNLNRLVSDRNVIRAGIEFNAVGRRVAYHMHPTHPDDPAIALRAAFAKRVNANDVIHVFRPLRPGQIRGISWMSRVLVKLFELDQYDDAELVRKKTVALFAGFIIKQAEDSSILGETTDSDETDVEVGIEPGTMQVLLPGEDVKFSEPADVGGSYEQFINTQLRAVAAGMGVTFEQLTGDLSKVNFSSIRAGLIEFRRRCTMFQQNILNFQFNRRVWREWLAQAVLAGALDMAPARSLDRSVTAVKWIGQGFEWVDPLKEQQAQQSAVRNAFKSRSEVVAQMGRDIEDVDNEIAADNKRADGLGIVADSDPRKVSKGGGAQGPEQLEFFEQEREAS